MLVLLALTAVTVVAALLVGGYADTAKSEGASLPVLQREPKIQVVGTYLLAHDHGGYRRIGIIFNRLRLPSPKQITVRIRCQSGCPEEGSGKRHFVAPRQMRGKEVLNDAILDVEMTRKGWIGLYTILHDAGTENPEEEEFCLLPGAAGPSACPRHKQRKARPQPVASVGQSPTAAPFSQVALPATNRTAITSIDGTRGDRAPYSAEFTSAYQPFTALSDMVTYLGVTVGDPAVPVGLDPSDRMALKLCSSASCAGTELAAASPHVNNYGLTTADIGDVPVVPGETYFLVWNPPEDAHGSQWLTFWHGGTATVAGSHEPEAIVRGFWMEEGEGPEEAPPTLARRDVVDYAGVQPPPAPYSGSFQFASQGFKALSDKITKIGVVVGNARLARDAVGPEITLRLCETSDCSTGILATATPFIDNYGLTEADIGDVAVSPGHTYFIYWQSPHKIEGASWVSYWLGQGPEIEEARLFQAFARGYDSGGGAPSELFFSEQSGHLGSPTFSEPEHALGQGPTIEPLSFVQVSCRLYSPQIESAEPDGYWYRIHSFPWNDQYYAVANTFWNGVAPGEKAEPINTDLNVPPCPA